LPALYAVIFLFFQRIVIKRIFLLQHLPQLSTGLHGFVFSSEPGGGGRAVTHVVCAAGGASERMALLRPVLLCGGVDRWLGAVLLEAKQALQVPSAPSLPVIRVPALSSLVRLGGTLIASVHARILLSLLV
jgi:hypothetical protein